MAQPELVGLKRQLVKASGWIDFKRLEQTIAGTHFVPQKTCVTTVGSWCVSGTDELMRRRISFGKRMTMLCQLRSRNP